MYILKELWRGNISPIERYVRPGSDYKKTSVEICKQIDCFLKTLTPEEKKQWEEICDLRNDMTIMAEEDAFVRGFRLGARIIMEVAGEYKGQFTGAGESS